MSDPVTNVAIEDVLSSIRRLVSEDSRVQPLAWRQEPAAAEATPDSAADAPLAEPPAGRLVLTPALRVMGDSEAAVAEDGPAAEVLSEAAVAEDGPAAEGLSEAAVAEDGPTAEGLSEAAVAEDGPTAESQSEAAVAEDGPTAEGLSEVEVAEDGPAAEGLSEVAVAEDGPTAEGLSEGETGDPYVLGAAVAEVMAWEDHHDDVAQGRDALDPAALAGAEAAEVISMAAEAPEAPAAAFVFASTRDGGLRDEGHAAAQAAQGSHAADAEEPDDSGLLLREDEGFLDEEALRELVADIVRQELQGALGERITRNVRKLVRREIHRALTSHELE